VSRLKAMPPAVENRLLAALPREDRERLLAHSEKVELEFAEVLGEPQHRIRHVLFPTGGFISLVTHLDKAATLEVGLIGDEGMLGTSLLLGVNVSPQRAIVQGRGSAWRIMAAPFCRELERSPPLRRELNRYLYVVTSQVALTAVCTHFHLVEARLARWLLMTCDRAHSDRFHITQEFMSFMLGVRREGVTTAAGVLRRRKLISYSRGEITILDRSGLQAAACSCYAAARKTYTSIMG
jgi:CRP-like cAMP-binding protein